MFLVVILFSKKQNKNNERECFLAGVIKGDGEGEIVVTFRHPFPEENSIAEVS